MQIFPVEVVINTGLFEEGCVQSWILPSRRNILHLGLLLSFVYIICIHYMYTNDRNVFWNIKLWRLYNVFSSWFGLEPLSISTKRGFLSVEDWSNDLVRWRDKLFCFFNKDGISTLAGKKKSVLNQVLIVILQPEWGPPTTDSEAVSQILVVFTNVVVAEKSITAIGSWLSWQIRPEAVKTKIHHMNIRVCSLTSLLNNKAK